ncbi:hypothetical protein [Alkalicoccus luteus]|uniref:Uncharacterized protein n=1 Tax=Alkalicoccus luteus TaxID=1237094 RepID=A0A969TVA5_9BACI|nr:hypothetical protein [Alkalicoccus luteus]NJP37791.1 hypothetical protein [Alkalicoccus luteus]
MKQVLPFILISVVVGALLYFLQDDYEGPFDPDHRSDASDAYWDAVLFVEGEDEEAEIGFRLSPAEDREFDPASIDMLEVFVDSSNVSFYFQDLDMEEFEEELIHRETCTVCSSVSQIEARMLVNWREDGETRSSQYQFSLVLEE